MHKKYLCIHGHFYQPPRENPWLNAIEQQPSAAPYHDWNERINSDCYLPNAAARVLDNQGLVRSIVNNYRHISFNFGPTLLSWLEEHGQRTYAAILEADSDSRQRLGYGNAIAQVYNHIIMPLATRRDKEVQVAWGISDFVMRFGRQPEGMWLAETAVDMETLEVLAAAGIRFTILAPGQAAAFREADSDTWHSTDAGRGIDPTRPYYCKLASGEEINIFFYDGPLSHAIAFEKLLENGDRFYNRILNAYAAERQWSQLLHLATDGESYGHHFQNGEMALAYCLNLAEKDAGIEVVNYATYLHNHPALTEVRIVENSAWSCAHGVGRWQEDCGCNAGSIANANQRWRKPLRNAFDILRDATDDYLQSEGDTLFVDTNAAVDAYADYFLRADKSTIKEDFDKRLLRPGLSEDLIVRAYKLLEMKRFAMLIYTSCAWFFDDISGIEPVQILKYAARLIHLGKINSMPLPENRFLDILNLAISNIEEHGTGRDIYFKKVATERYSLAKVAAHVAVEKLLWQEQSPATLHGYPIAFTYTKQSSFNQLQLTAGRVDISCPISLKVFAYEYCALHLSGLDINIFIKSGDGGQVFTNFVHKAMQKFEEKSLADVITFLPQYFDHRNFSLADLFPDDRNRVITHINRDTQSRMGRMILDFFGENKKLFIQLSSNNFPLPLPYRMTIDFAMEHYFNKHFRKLLKEDLENESELVVNLTDQSQQMLQADVKLTQGQVNERYLPGLGQLLDRLFAGDMSSEGYLRVLLAIDQLADTIDWWTIQDQLLSNLGKAKLTPAQVDASFLQICHHLHIRAEDFINA
jgi:alpha-amylase/alpha-mannosidase (GH57 family)